MPFHPRLPFSGRSQKAQTVQQTAALQSERAPLRPDAAAPHAAQEIEEIDEVVSVIRRAGLVTPALIALQVGKPLSWIGGQVLWMLQPFSEGLGFGRKPGRDPLSVGGLARFLESSSAIDRLIESLEHGTGLDAAQEPQEQSETVRAAHKRGGRRREF